MVAIHRRPRARCLVVAACVVAAGALGAGCSGGPDPVTDVTATSATLNAHGRCDGGTPTPCEYQWRWRRTGDAAWTTGPRYGPVRGVDAAGRAARADRRASSRTRAYEWQIGGRGDGGRDDGLERRPVLPHARRAPGRPVGRAGPERRPARLQAGVLRRLRDRRAPRAVPVGGRVDGGGPTPARSRTRAGTGPTTARGCARSPAAC